MPVYSVLGSRLQARHAACPACAQARLQVTDHAAANARAGSRAQQALPLGALLLLLVLRAARSTHLARSFHTY